MSIHEYIFIKLNLPFSFKSTLETAMKQLFFKILAATTVCAGLQSAALAHDFTADIAQFNKAAAAKKMDSKEGIAARVAL